MLALLCLLCHACRHDLKLAEDRVFLKARRFIPAHSEIFVGYGATYWKIRDMLPQVMLQLPAQQQQQAPQAVASPAAKAAAAAGQGSPADVLQDGSPAADQQTPQHMGQTPAQDSSSSDDEEDEDEDDQELSPGSLALTYSCSWHDDKKRLMVCPTPIPMQEPSESPPETPTAAQQASPDRASTLQEGSADWQEQLRGFEHMTISKTARGKQHESSPPAGPSSTGGSSGQLSTGGSCKQMHSRCNPGGLQVQAPLQQQSKPSRCNASLQQQSKPSSKPPARPSGAAAAGASSPAGARTLLGLPGVSAAAAVEAGDEFIAPDLLDSESEDDDGSWTPGYKPKKNTAQRCTPGSARRPTRRRRAPNLDLAYNGTWQAAKPIDKW
jgi:hypothetical protein